MTAKNREEHLLSRVISLFGRPETARYQRKLAPPRRIMTLGTSQPYHAGRKGPLSGPFSQIRRGKISTKPTRIRNFSHWRTPTGRILIHPGSQVSPIEGRRNPDFPRENRPSQSQISSIRRPDTARSFSARRDPSTGRFHDPSTAPGEPLPWRPSARGRRLCAHGAWHGCSGQGGHRCHAEKATRHPSKS